MANITPTISLKDTRFTPLEFKPVEYNPVEVDTRILNKSLALREERQLRANTALGEFKNKNEQYLKNLPNDVTLQNDLNNIIKEYKNPIEDAINRGDYSQAYNFSVNQGADLYNDARFKGRLQAVEEYNKYKTNLDDLFKNEKIDKDALNYYKETQTFNYIPKLEADGSESKTNIGKLGDLKDVLRTPSYEAVATAAFKLINPNTTSTGEGHTNSKGGGHTEQTSTTKVTYDEIWKNILNLYNTNSELQTQILRDMDIKVYTLEKYQKQINKGEQLSFEDNEHYKKLKDQLMLNGTINKDPIAFLKAQTKVEAELLAYTNYSHTEHTTENPEKQSGGGGGGTVINNIIPTNQNNYNPPVNNVVPGPLGEQKTDYGIGYGTGGFWKDISRQKLKGLFN